MMNETTIGRVMFRVRARWAAKRIEYALHVLIRHHTGANVISLSLADRFIAAAKAEIAALLESSEGGA